MKVVNGEIINENYFAAIRELEEGDDPANPGCWVKANPILQHENAYSVNLLKEIKEDYTRAYGSGDPDKVREFLTKRCNLWQQDSEEKYLSS